MHQPFTAMLLDAAGLRAGQRVLDVGCGAGGTTRAAARLTAPGEVTGVDLSAPMLELARASAQEAGLGNVAFHQDDVQVRRFGADRFDAVISRFGVMFFEDPVAAFTNLASATRPGGRLAFVCWQPLATNEWLTLPEAALAAHVPPPDDFGTQDGPGMFAFADEARVRSVLAAAGWQEATVTPHHPSILVGGGGRRRRRGDVPADRHDRPNHAGQRRRGHHGPGPGLAPRRARRTRGRRRRGISAQESGSSRRQPRATKSTFLDQDSLIKER